jgi:hypothetical protein
VTVMRRGDELKSGIQGAGAPGLTASIILSVVCDSLLAALALAPETRARLATLAPRHSL